jgi:monoamine oxidase
MTNGDTEVAIVGGGAAGIAAARRLHDAGVPCLLVEARERLGGRAWTVPAAAGARIDLGCGWLHSADRNPWAAIAVAQGHGIDKTPPPWARLSLPYNFPPAL